MDKPIFIFYNYFLKRKFIQLNSPYNFIFIIFTNSTKSPPAKNFLASCMSSKASSWSSGIKVPSSYSNIPNPKLAENSPKKFVLKNEIKRSNSLTNTYWSVKSNRAMLLAMPGCPPVTTRMKKNPVVWKKNPHPSYSIVLIGLEKLVYVSPSHILRSDLRIVSIGENFNKFGGHFLEGQSQLCRTKSSSTECRNHPES